MGLQETSAGLERWQVERQSFNKRRYVRTRLRAAVTLSHPDIGVINLHTEDISDGGAYLVADGQVLPGLGELVDIQIQGLPGGDAPVVRMKVMRVDADGIGLEFVDPD